MEPVFNLDLTDFLAKNNPIIVELGCGLRNKKGVIGIDRLALHGVDIIADMENGLGFFPEDSVNEIHSKSFFEHIENFENLMFEIWRVLKPDGKLFLYVPHFSNPYYFSDYTHRRFFGLYSFEYFSQAQTRYSRKVPHFYTNFGVITCDLTLVFTSPWRTRRLFKRLLGRIVNSTPWSQEFYEENLCYLIPCYGIRAILKPEK